MITQYIDNKELQIAMSEYNVTTLEIGSDVFSNNGNFVGYLKAFHVNSDLGHGTQIYVVVPTEADLTADPAQVKEVTVLFRGSTGIGKIISPEWLDVVNDWVYNDLPMASRIIGELPSTLIGAALGGPITGPIAGVGAFAMSNPDQGTAQLREAADYLKTVMDTYPNARFKLYGHSLGSMNTQYAVASLPSNNYLDRIDGVWVYNGPNTYNVLSDSQKQAVNRIKSKIHNYIDRNDFIGYLGHGLLGMSEEGSTHAVGIVHYVDGLDKGMTPNHMTEGYQYVKSEYRV